MGHGMAMSLPSLHQVPHPKDVQWNGNVVCHWNVVVPIRTSLGAENCHGVPAQQCGNGGITVWNIISNIAISINLGYRAVLLPTTCVVWKQDWRVAFKKNATSLSQFAASILNVDLLNFFLLTFTMDKPFLIQNGADVLWPAKEINLPLFFGANFDWLMAMDWSERHAICCFFDLSKTMSGDWEAIMKLHLDGKSSGSIKTKPWYLK